MRSYELPVGIAHEIKNPLNFVNNFAGLSVELLGELREAAAPAIAELDKDQRTELDEIVVMLTGNLEKIAEHGRRADNIVKSMLEHSRSDSGERREVDLNTLVEDALNLAYHGARAQDQSFNITLELDFDQALAPIELAPQEMTRVFLNLFGNGFHAASKRQRDGNDPEFQPTLKVSTRGLGDAVEISVRDGFGATEFRDQDRVTRFLFEELPQKIGANGRVQNALRNSDNQNARIEHDRAVDDELLGSLADHTDLYALYNTDKAFKAWLQERLFDAAKRAQNSSAANDVRLVRFSCGEMVART